MKWTTSDVKITQSSKFDPLKIEVTAESHGHHITVKLDNDFISTIRSLPPVERDGKAYVEFVRQIK